MGADGSSDPLAHAHGHQNQVSVSAFSFSVFSAFSVRRGSAKNRVAGRPMCPGGRYPPKAIAGATSARGPSSVPGLSTALQPTSAPSPRMAPEFPQTSGINLFADADRHLAVIQAVVRTDGPGAEMGLVPENGIADVVVVRRRDLIHQKRILVLAGVAKHAPFADDDISAQKRTRTDFRVRSDIRRADERRISRQLYGRMNPKRPLA